MSTSKIYWLSRHELSPAQQQALKDLHGEDVEVVKEAVMVEGLDGLTKYIEAHTDGFVYCVAGAPHYVHAALATKTFGVFENQPGQARRRDVRPRGGLPREWWPNQGRLGQPRSELGSGRSPRPCQGLM